MVFADKQALACGGLSVYTKFCSLSAYDDAMAESFIASLEGEPIERNGFQRNAQARMAVFAWIEGWYTPRRRHSGLGYLSLLNFERSKQARLMLSKPPMCMLNKSKTICESNRYPSTKVGQIHACPSRENCPLYPCFSRVKVFSSLPMMKS